MGGAGGGLVAGSGVVDSGMVGRVGVGCSLPAGGFDDGVGGFFLEGSFSSETCFVDLLVWLRVPVRAGLDATPLRFAADAGLVIASVEEGM